VSERSRAAGPHSPLRLEYTDFIDSRGDVQRLRAARAWAKRQPQKSQQPPKQPPEQNEEGRLSGGLCNLLIYMVFMAPEVGLEPTTLRLTAECSAIELLRNTSVPRLVASPHNFLVITNCEARVKEISDPAVRRPSFATDRQRGSVAHPMMSSFACKPGVVSGCPPPSESV
jgi:hypothetical protein